MRSTVRFLRGRGSARSPRPAGKSHFCAMFALALDCLRRSWAWVFQEGKELLDFMMFANYGHEKNCDGRIKTLIKIVSDASLQLAIVGDELGGFRVVRFRNVKAQTSRGRPAALLLRFYKYVIYLTVSYIHFL